MKKNKLYLHLFLSCLLFQTTCQRVTIEVATGDVSNILATTANVSGFLISAGDGIKKYGHCWSKSPDPTNLDMKTEFGSTIGLGEFTSFLNGLEPGTKYYARAYITSGNALAYGGEISFTTLEDAPSEVTTTNVSGITTSSAISGGNIIDNTGTPVIARGVCWGNFVNPTINDSKTINGSGSGTFVSNISGLLANTTYYLRAYATKGSGTIYGNQISFTTSF